MWVILNRLILRKKLEQEAAFVLTNMALIGLNNRRLKNEELRNEANARITKKIKNHLTKFKAISRYY